ncbi:hypothetical protein [Nocardia fluminea]|uniref:hypothetical protein n=1 Tax=Nocardia fluminea TaxID=134984 RepID=UPI003D0A9F73
MTRTEKEKEARGARVERGVTLFTAGIASVVAAQGMYVMFSESLNMHPALTALCFAFIELMVVASAMRARTSQLTTGSAGVDGIAMWVLTILSGVLAASHATEDLGLLILRLAAPLVAAWGWERSMALERRQLTGRTERRTNWRISPQRLLVRWGIADPTDRTNGEVAIERRLADLARAADAVRLTRSIGKSERAERRAVQRLHRAIDKAAEDGVVLGEESVRDRLAAHLEGRFSAYTLPNYRPVTDWADHTTRAAAPTLDAIVPDQTVRAEFAELTDELDRELSAHAIGTHRPAIAPTGHDRSRAEASPSFALGTSIARADGSVDRAPIASGTVAHGDADRAPIARDDLSAPRATLEKIGVAAREGVVSQAAVAHAALPVSDVEIAHDREPIEDTDRAPIAAHNPDELGTDRWPIAAHAVPSVESDAAPEDSSRADNDSSQVPVARATEPAHDRRAPAVSLVSIAREATPIARESVDRARGSAAPVARETTTQGALARAVEPQPIARGDGSGVRDHGPFARELSRAEAAQFARAVTDRGLVKQPVDVLTEVFVLASQGIKPNAIGKVVGRPHSTVGRALERVEQVLGPRAV